MATATLSPPIQAVGVELFRAGKQRDSQGREREWSESDLKEMATSYNEIVGTHDAPILVGHDGNTAYGWLKKTWVEDGVLKGDLEDVDPKFAEAVNRKTYRKRSISIYPRDHADNPTPGKLNIRHLAYVGIPAVKGLKDHTFNDSGKDFIEFDEMPFFGSGIAAIALILSGMRDRLIEDKGLEVANEAFPKDVMEALQREASRGDYLNSETFFRSNEQIYSQIEMLARRLDEFQAVAMRGMPNYSEFKEMNLKQMMADKKVTAVKGISPTDLQAIVSGDMEASAEQMQMIADALGMTVDELKPKKKTTDMSEELQARVVALEAENKQLKAERETERITNFVEGLVRDRKVLPADKQSTIELALAMPNETEMQFSEGAGTVSATPRQRFLDSLSSRSELWSAKDMPTKPADAPEFTESSHANEEGFDTESIKLDRQIRAKAKEMGLDLNEPGTYAEAMNALNVTI
jgi:FtsZ-binding cell division protein ZapB